jgi:hypothetical protein
MKRVEKEEEGREEEKSEEEKSFSFKKHTVENNQEKVLKGRKSQTDNGQK